MLSIVIPVYNALPYLKRTLYSLYLATESEFELILVDDCSNQETRDFLQSLSGNLKVIHNKERRYVSHCWNLGIQAASGEYIAILNSDVKVRSTWDIHLMNALGGDTWIASPYMIDPLSPTPFANDTRFPDIHLAGPCFVMKKSLFDTVGLFPESIKIWCNDKWLSWIVTEVYKKEAVFLKDVVIDHFKSKSIDDMTIHSREQFVKIVNADKAAFKRIQDKYHASKK